MGKRLDKSNEYWVFDGADIPKEKLLTTGTYIQVDIDRDNFGEKHQTYEDVFSYNYSDTPQDFDYGFILETIEHQMSPYNSLVEMKKMVKRDGEIIISFPDETVWHNVVYPGLLWPRQNFEIFLGQMALPIIEFWHWQKGWPAYHYRCRNAGWEEKRMIYPKHETKFKFATPLEMTNL